MTNELVQLLREVSELLRHAEFTSPTHAGAAIDRAAKLDAYRASLEAQEPLLAIRNGNIWHTDALERAEIPKNTTVYLYRCPPTSAVPEGWAGWACHYPGKLPRLYGDRRIAELNCHTDQGEQLIYLVETAAPQQGGGE